MTLTAPSAPSKRRSSTGKAAVAKPKGFDYWLEVQVSGDWVCVDVTQGKVNCAGEMEARASKPMLYVVAANADGSLKVRNIDSNPSC